MNPSAYRGKVHEQVVTGCGCTVFGGENSMTLWTLRQPSPVSFYKHQFYIWVNPDHMYNTYALFSFRGSKQLNTVHVILLKVTHWIHTLPYDTNFLHFVLADDFKPASVDTTRPAELVVGDTNEITVTVPHVQVHAWTKMFFLNFSCFVSLKKVQEFYNSVG